MIKLNEHEIKMISGAQKQDDDIVTILPYPYPILPPSDEETPTWYTGEDW